MKGILKDLDRFLQAGTSAALLVANRSPSSISYTSSNCEVEQTKKHQSCKKKRAWGMMVVVVGWGQRREGTYYEKEVREVLPVFLRALC